MNQAKPTGLLLSGGGAKGAFQIGALQALWDAGMLSDITAIAGSSVGALNMVLYALGNLEAAKRLWLGLRKDDLLTGNAEGALFSRTGMKALLADIPLDVISRSPFALFVSVYNATTHATVYHRLNGLTSDAIRTLLLATSALPAAFAPEQYDGDLCMDGGLTPEGDHCIPPLYALGHRNLLLVSLNSEFSVYGVQNSRFVRVGKKNIAETYADCNFTVIKPLHPLGNLLTGTLDFSPDSIRKRIADGYDDAHAMLSNELPLSETIGGVNAYLTTLMQQLFPDAAALEAFVTQYETAFAPNVPFPTLGGALWYNDLFAVDGWRLQHHRTHGLQAHYRIIDRDGVRRAWVLDPNALIAALHAYAAQTAPDAKP